MSRSRFRYGPCPHATIGRGIIRILAIFVFNPVRQTGSHIHLLHQETRRLITVPNLPEIATGTLLSILKQANIGKDEFLKHVK